MFDQKKQEPLFPDFTKKKEEPKKKTKVDVPKLDLKEIVEVVRQVKQKQMINICAACGSQKCGYRARMDVEEGDPRIRP